LLGNMIVSKTIFLRATSNSELADTHLVYMQYRQGMIAALFIGRSQFRRNNFRVSLVKNCLSGHTARGLLAAFLLDD
jgi:hypothetical protein